MVSTSTIYKHQLLSAYKHKSDLEVTEVTYQHRSELSWESYGGATNGLGLLALDTMAEIATRQ